MVYFKLNGQFEVYCSVQSYICLHVFRFCVAVNDVGIRSICFMVIIICYMSLFCKDNVIFSEGDK